MIGLGVEIKGDRAVISGLQDAANLPMGRIHQEMATAQVENIKHRVRAGKQLDGSAMPPSLRAEREGGTTLIDTGDMIEMSLRGWGSVPLARVAFSGLFAALKARWNHFGVKLASGKWRPRKRTFFGFGPGDRETLLEAGQLVIDDHLRAIKGRA